MAPEDVDICVTCVADKPPKLPLREELVSLGVEVVYNAKGVGVHAVRHERKELVKNYRKLVEKKKGMRIFPKSEEEKARKIKKQKEIERQLKRQCKSISYDAYTSVLQRSDSDDSSSLPSLNSVVLKTKRRNKQSEKTRIDQMAVVLEGCDRNTEQVRLERIAACEDRHARETRREQAICQSQKVVSSYKKLHQPEQRTSTGRVGHPASFPSPISGATSPTVSHTTQDVSTTGGDDASENSTFEKHDGSQKELVSATGNRWWYEQQTAVQDLRRDSRQEAIASHLPPQLPPLHEESRDEAPQTLEPTHSSWCGLNTMCGWNRHKVDEPKTNTADSIVPENDLSNAHELDYSVGDLISQSFTIDLAVFGSESNSESESNCRYDEREARKNRFSYHPGENESDSDGYNEHNKKKENRVRGDRKQEDQSSDRDKLALERIGISSKNEQTNSTPPLNEVDKVTINEDCQFPQQASTESKILPQESKESVIRESHHVEHNPVEPQSPVSHVSAGTGDGSEGSLPGEGGKSAKRELFSMLSAPVVNILEIRDKFYCSPSLARAKWSREDGRLPLHSACDRGLPNRFQGGSTALVETLGLLRSDLKQWNEVIEAVLKYNVNGCKVVDKNGDLPLHIAARRLIEWEGNWRTKLGGVTALPGAAGVDIDMLHQEMVRCIEVLLDPILHSRGLCRKRGSVGRILPLHIACIYPVSFEKMKALLRTYPEAAAVPCDLGPLLSLIVNYSLPLELLERDRSVSASIDGEDDRDATADERRRSNLLFAYNPNVDPFRYEPDRLASLELLIREATKSLSESKAKGEITKIDTAAQSGWIWLCTFDGDAENARVDYSKCVKNILSGLNLDAVKLLSEIKTFSGPITETATPKCKAVLESALDGRDRSEFDSPLPNLCLTIQSSTSSLTGSVLKKDYNEVDVQPIETKRNCNFVASFIRKIFNVQEDENPSSFIILPYKLVAGPDGALTLDTPTAAAVAIRFAQYLLEVTQPSFLHHQLEKKSIQHAGYRLNVEQMEEWTLTEEKHRNIQRELINIYRSNPAYLYLIDESDGIPIVKGERGEKYYPIRIEDPVETVRRLFPLMLMGMVHMRGEKSLATLMKTIVDAGLPTPESWVSTAEDIVDLMILDTQDQDTVVSAALSRKDALVEFVCNANQEPDNRRETTSDGCEWVVELTLLKLTIERSDIRRSFAGLKPAQAPNGVTIWTRTNNLEPAKARKQQRRNTKSRSRARSNSDVESLLGVPSVTTAETNLLDTLLDDEALAANRRPPSGNPSPSQSRNESPVELRSRHTSSNRPLARKSPQRRQRSRHASPFRPRSRSVSRSQNESIDDTPQVLQSVTSDSADSADSITSKLGWRSKLEKQEAYLNRIRDSLHSIDVSDSELMSLQGEKLLDDLSQQLSLYDLSSATSRCVGYENDDEDDNFEIVSEHMDRTKKLLLRLCNLEERLLTREIDLQQIKLDLHNFELEAASRSHEWNLTKSQLEVE